MKQEKKSRATTAFLTFTESMHPADMAGTPTIRIPENSTHFIFDP
jgi:hypothetical protein